MTGLASRRHPLQRGLVRIPFRECGHHSLVQPRRTGRRAVRQCGGPDHRAYDRLGAAGLRWVRQEPNRDTLWNAVNFGTVRPFLMGLWRQGAFGTGDPDDVFTIVCDASNNPPDEVDNGNFHLDVTFYPSRPAERIVISVGQQPSGASAGES